MALRPKVLRIKANKVEEKEMKKYEIKPQQVCLLDAMLHQHYTVSRPDPNDYRTRKDLIRIFNEIAKEIYGESNDIPTVVEFGSFLMDLFSVRSDLDLSVNFGRKGGEVTREKKIQTLRKFARKFYALKSQGHVSGVRPIPFARVPILKVVDRGTRVECDLSVENRDGILKSQLIRMICSIDERFQILSFLMKDWANAQKINSSKDGTLNSLSIILLVAFHLQTRKPPVLPPFSSLFKDGTDPASVQKLLSNFVNFGKSNKESVGELFISLLIKLASVEILWPKGLCASVYDGSWTSKTWDSKVAPISVEDFADREQNVARAVAAAEIKKIYKCVHNSLKITFGFMDGHTDGSKLLAILFGKDARLLPVVANRVNMVAQAVAPCVIPRPIHVQDSTMFCAGDVNLSNAAPLNIPPHLTKPIGAKITGGSSSTLTKRLSSSDSREEIPSRSWQKGGWVAQQDSVLAKRIRRTGDWSGRPAENCWGPNSSNWPKRQQESDVAKARPPTNSCGTMHVNVGEVSEARNLTNLNFPPLDASGAKRVHSRHRR